MQLEDRLRELRLKDAGCRRTARAPNRQVGALELEKHKTKESEVGGEVREVEIKGGVAWWWSLRAGALNRIALPQSGGSLVLNRRREQRNATQRNAMAPRDRGGLRQGEPHARTADWAETGAVVDSVPVWSIG